MFNFGGVGLFFNQMIDLERIATLARERKIDWIAPLMSPDQSSVQLNRRDYTAWRDKLVPLGIKFAHWLDCRHDPDVDADMAEWLVNKYPTDGLLMNCENHYENAGKWRGKVLCDLLLMQPATANLPKFLSYPSTPAERYNMDYRAFEKAGFIFGPQAYWTDPTIVGNPSIDPKTPKLLCASTSIPTQIHIARDYRLWLDGVKEKHWGRIVEQTNATTALVSDLQTNTLYTVPVISKQDGQFHYMEIDPARLIFKRKDGIKAGKLLGFQSQAKIRPTVGVYEPRPTPSDIVTKLREVPWITGASIYLGDTSESIHVEAVASVIKDQE